jgi:hypothetical protein
MYKRKREKESLLHSIIEVDNARRKMVGGAQTIVLRHSLLFFVFLNKKFVFDVTLFCFFN